MNHATRVFDMRKKSFLMVKRLAKPEPGTRIFALDGDESFAESFSEDSARNWPVIL